jgi:ADP-ribose pyrophosphatase YjhB (NUDIX family)
MVATGADVLDTGAGAIVTARFCPLCGGLLEVRRPVANERERQVCIVCGRVHYRNAKPSVSALIVRDGRVLMLRRAREPRRGAWDLPGGFLEADEHPSIGAVREVREETGLVVMATALFGVYLGTYGPADDPDYVLNVVYLAEARDGEPQSTAEASEVAWFAQDEHPGDMAFAHNRAAVLDWCAQQ